MFLPHSKVSIPLIRLVAMANVSLEGVPLPTRVLALLPTLCVLQLHGGLEVPGPNLEVLVRNCFKEPQKAVSCIQKILDGDTAATALLADLSKAFERVNPYWILELLRIRRAPRWLYAYAKFVLFHRRVSHKVQGRLLPSRTVRQGVDMGRSFSVYLFCLAMDPLFTDLNRIPGVISVQGYIDDTTIVGNSHSLSWLEEVAYTYECLRSAGFVVTFLLSCMYHNSESQKAQYHE